MPTWVSHWYIIIFGLDWIGYHPSRTFIRSLRVRVSGFELSISMTSDERYRLNALRSFTLLGVNNFRAPIVGVGYHNQF